MSLPGSLLLLAHAASTWYMVGLIWFVQVVHYPLFDRVGEEGFAAYEARHQDRTFFVVGPPMLIEALCAVWIVFRGEGPALLTWTGLALIVLIWASTALVQIPCHDRLAAGFSVSTHALLVGSNWVRTCSWTLRGIIALVLLYRPTQPAG
jgi:hypothetical protein